MSTFRRLFCLTLVLSTCACGIGGYGALRSSSSEAVYHRVRSGETLWSISKRYGVSPDSLVMLNDVRDPAQLSIGKRLLVGYLKSNNERARLDSPDSYRGKTPITVSKGRLMWPVKGARLASRFGKRGRRFHDGLDFAARSGTPVYAAHTGIVAYAGRKLSGYGKLVIIRGARDGLVTVYAHNRRLLVRTGEKVRRGEKIAEVGSTGRSSGPHLHFEVRTRDKRGRMVAVDPLPLLNGKGKSGRFRVNESLAPILAKLGF